MTTKEQLLSFLENNRDCFLSGEEIALRLQISRTAVWKAVTALRQDGYPIDAVPKRGYRLRPESDRLSAPGIARYLNYPLELSCLEETDSTNRRLRLLADQGAPQGTVLVAAAQSAGRGRQGRSFFSPKDSGVYMSILLRPQNWLPAQSVCVTTMAAVAMCQALEYLGEDGIGIKWVNDIYRKGKKVCGILTEGAFDLESGGIDYLVLGIGINVYPPEQGFPTELRDIAGAVFDEPHEDGKNRITAAFLNAFWKLYSEGGDYAQQYRERSVIIGSEITVVLPNRERSARVLNIDDSCHLLVQYADGSTEALSSGEIRIQLNRRKESL